MKKIFLGALVTLFALANVSISNADLVLDFNGGTVTQSNGNVINYTVTVNNGTLTGDPATGVFDSDETNNNGMTNANFTIMFTQDVDFIVSATPTQRGNSGDNSGVRFTTNSGVFDASAVVDATIGGDGTTVLTFQRPNGAATSASNLDFGSFTVAGTSQITFEAISNSSNREAFVFEIADATASVPEPGSLAVLGLGSLALFVRRRC